MQTRLLLVALGLLWAKSLAQLPEATITPALQTVAAGSSVTLSCITTGPAEWRRNNILISEDSDYSIDTAENRLTVTNFSVELAGNYTCVARNGVGSVSSSTAVLQLAVHEVNFFSTELSTPHEVTVVENMPTAINCGPFSNTPSSDLIWDVEFGSGFVPITLGNERATTGLNHSLYLLEPRMINDGDLFACHLRTTPLGVVSDGYVRINVQASTLPEPDPFILVAPQDVMTWIGQTVSFECIPGGSGAASRRAVWSPEPAGSRTSSDSFRISIPDVTAENQGTITCTIDGIESVSATLTIIDPPVLTDVLPTSLVSLIYGDPLSLACSSSTSQITHWEWFHNGIRLSETGPSFSVGSTTLADSGSYQCIAYNPAGYSQSATLVQVDTIPADISTNLPPTQVAFRDQAFSLSCSAQGAPPPTYTWFKSGIPLESGSSFHVDENGGLLIRTVDGSSEGNYMCMATNRLPDGSMVGMDNISTILRTIMPTTIERQLPPIFSVQVATTTVLYCEVSSEPGVTVEFSWLKDGLSLTTDTNGRVRYLNRISSGNLQIEQVDFGDEGDYQCIINTAHEDIPAPEVRTIVSTVAVTATPVAPLILTINSTSPTSFYIEWAFTGVPTSVRNYIVEIQTPPNSTSPWVPVHTKSTSSITAADISSDDLTAFTLYGVRVVAMYVDGDRVLSEERLLQTGTDVPADSPTEVIGTAPNNNALDISWRPPSTPRGEIISYTVQYRLKGETDFMTVSTRSSDTKYIINDLKEFERFEVRVAAVTSAGQGPFSALIEVVTVEGGVLDEPEGGAFVTSIGFIALVVALLVLLAVCVVVVVMVTRYKCSKEKAERSYHFRHSGLFKGVNIVGMDTTDAAALSETAMASYGPRSNRVFSSASPTGSRADPVDPNLEGGSLFGGTVTTGTPQLSMGSAARLINAPAPSYIDPPPFEETVMRSRSHSANSAYTQDFDKPVRDWDIEQGSGLEVPDLPNGFANPSVAYVFDDSDNSIEKNMEDLASEDTDRESEHTQYSHLAEVTPRAGGVQRSPGAQVFHHQLNLPLSACSSAGVPVSAPVSVGESVNRLVRAPISVGELVDNRLLRAQSEDTESPINYATYV